MARKVEQLTIFLASPGDVLDERKVVREVVDEVNRSFAREKGVHLEVIGWDTDAFPSYGGDGQAIINEQIGDMTEHDLFVGILWNRFGTPTPRADSGTEEEFNRADEYYRSKGHPDIQYYFCQRPFNLTSEKELEQKGKVLKFKSRVQENGLTWNFDDANNFKILFQRHLQFWLTRRYTTTPNPPSTIEVRSEPSFGSFDVPKDAALEIAEPCDDVLEGIPLLPPEAHPEPEDEKEFDETDARSGTKPKAGLSEVISGSGNWILLGEDFFKAEKVIEKSATELFVVVQPNSSEEDSKLRALRGDRSTGRSNSFAYQNIGGIAQISNAERHSEANIDTWSFSLDLDNSLRPGYSRAIEFLQGISEARAIYILLNKLANPDEYNGIEWEHENIVSQLISQYPGWQSPICGLWHRFNNDIELFLPVARLWLVYNLLISNSVQSIIDLELGPLEDSKMAVKFRGLKQPSSQFSDPEILEIQGICVLDGAYGNVYETISQPISPRY